MKRICTHIMHDITASIPPQRWGSKTYTSISYVTSFNKCGAVLLFEDVTNIQVIAQQTSTLTMLPSLTLSSVFVRPCSSHDIQPSFTHSLSYMYLVVFNTSNSSSDACPNLVLTIAEFHLLTLVCYVFYFKTASWFHSLVLSWL